MYIESETGSGSDPDPKPIEKYNPDPKKNFRFHNTEQCIIFYI